MYRAYRVMVTRTQSIDVALDDSLVPDDEWRASFYPSVRTLQDVAEMFGRCKLLFDMRPENLDGFYGVEAATEVQFEPGFEEGEEVTSEEVGFGLFDPLVLSGKATARE